MWVEVFINDFYNLTIAQSSDESGPRVPELLTDIMNLEALLADDDLPQDNAGEDPNSEQMFYQYLMQLTERRLYKLVRWARNLPQFGAISVTCCTFLGFCCFFFNQ
jgi:hypothetical protein